MDKHEAAAAEATQTLAAMKAAYDAQPEQQLARAEQRAAAMGNDTYGRVAADAEVARLRRQAEGNTANPDLYLSDAQRVNNSVDGIIDHLGAGTTAGSQIPGAHLHEAVQDLLSKGVEPDKVRSFLAHGSVIASVPGESREDQIAIAEEWRQRLMRDEDMQKKLFAGDPDLVKQFNLFAMYAADARGL
jgi:hypothetical protein